MAEAQEKQTANDTFIIERVFNAPQALVWTAWTDPALLTKWFGPKGCTAELIKFELRPGGIWHSRIQMPGGPAMWGKCVFREVTPPSCLVWVHAFSDEQGNLTHHPLQPNWPLELLTTVIFEAQGDKTKITLTWVPLNSSNIELKTFRDAIGGMKQGWGGTFDQLENFLSQ